ncbi:MAG: glutathione S-transferase family protein [Gammaproteobacteria bacterium]|jgi:glutathione S-transferase
MSRILYSGTRNASSWAFRAWLALKEAHVEFVEELVDIRRPQRYANLNRIGEFSPSASVPVLVDGETVIFDSLAIMEYANDLSDGALLPRDPKERASARAFVAWQHAGLSGLCPHLSFESAFYPDKRAMTRDEQHQAGRVYQAWERQLDSSGGPYLFGSLSLADLAFVPTVLRLVTHSKDPGRWPAVQAWSEALLARATVKDWLADANDQPIIRDASYYP